MTTMYDAVTPSAIPANAAVVAGYVDGAYAWSAADWARFPAAVKVRIAVFPRTNDGHVLDVEQGDATPAQAPGWVAMRRAAGIDPIVYCNTSTWSSVISAFRSAGVAAPHYWIAQYDGSPAIPAGAVAKQYNDPPGSGGNYDISNASQAFVNAITGGAMTTPEFYVADMTPDGLMDLGRIMSLHQNADSVKATGWGPVQNIPAAAEANGLKAALAALSAKLDAANATLAALSGALSADEAALLAAIKAQPTGGQVDVTALAATLAPVLAPLLPADATPQQVGAAVVTALADHLATAAPVA